MEALLTKTLPEGLWGPSTFGSYPVLIVRNKVDWSARSCRLRNAIPVPLLRSRMGHCLAQESSHTIESVSDNAPTCPHNAEEIAEVYCMGRATQQGADRIRGSPYNVYSLHIHCRERRRVRSRDGDGAPSALSEHGSVGIVTIR